VGLDETKRARRDISDESDLMLTTIFTSTDATSPSHRSARTSRERPFTLPAATARRSSSAPATRHRASRDPAVVVVGLRIFSKSASRE
jgi:hypothetical protein